VEEVRDRIEGMLSGAGARVGTEAPLLAEELTSFYRSREYRPLWVGDAGPLPGREELVAAIRRAGSEGLVPEDYHLSAILAQTGEDTPDGIAGLDLLLTGAFARYARDVGSGRPHARQADPEWFLVSDRGDHLQGLASAIAAGTLGKTVAGLPPPDPRYARLREALDRYRRIAARGGWPVELGTEALKSGVRDPAVLAVRERLRATGDLQEPGGDELFDPDLERAVRRFQTRLGLEADGVVGKKTRSALAVPVADRISQIIVNMERWRWMPRDLGLRYILVNMAGFDLRAFEGGREALGMRVIVGRAYRRTPSFGKSMTYLVFHPHWNIPPKLAVLDVLPKVRKDPNHLSKEGIRVFSGWGPGASELDPDAIDWSMVPRRPFPFKLRQDPGPRNALGRIKFMLPNRFDVYLHDTPHRELFRRAVRTFSSGCIRLEKPLDLAAFVLKPDPRWDPDRIQEAVESFEQKTVSLTRPIPVYVVYWTAWVEEDGTVHFRDDVYGRDKRLEEALSRQTAPRPTGPK